MADFTIEGNPGSIRSKAVLMDQKGQLFFDTGDSLSKIDTSGWTGRAADTFRDAHDLEPERWVRAGNGFKKASAALTTYAGALEAAQHAAGAAREEHARGDRETQRSRAAYDSYLGQMRSYWAQGGTEQAEPFVDHGEPIRQAAINSFNTAKADLDAAAHACAAEVRAGCADAPEEPNWLESGFRVIGGVLEGAGEAVWDLLTMVPFSPVNMVMDAYRTATGELTPEELMKKYELSAENAWDIAQAMYTGLTTDPVGFGKELGKSLLDVDTWADDPARALGHLVPDAIAAVATGGAGAAVTRGSKFAVDGLDALSDLAKFRHLDSVDDLAGYRRLGDGAPRSLFELDKTPESYRQLDDQLIEPSYSRDNRTIIDRDYEIFGRDPDTGQPLTREQFEDRWIKDTPDGRTTTSWAWPDFDGAVNGTQRIVAPADVPRMDRIGGPDGFYFTDDGTMMSERSLPPDRLNFDRSQWDINRDHPDLQNGTVRIEKAEVAPAFGQQGGGVQYRFLDADDKPITQERLEKDGIIARPPVPEFDVGNAVTGAAVTHGAQAAERFADEYDGAGR